MKRLFLFAFFFIVLHSFAFSSGVSEQHWKSSLDSSWYSSYDIIRDSIALMNQSVVIKDVHASDIDSIYQAVLLDHPNFFWIKSAEYDALSQTLTFTYCTDINGRLVMQNEIDGVVSSIEADSVQDILKWFSENCCYDSKNLDQTMYSAIVLKRGVCASFAKAFQYVALLNGIDCTSVTGTIGRFAKPHDFNIVYENGNEYVIDVSSILTL